MRAALFFGALALGLSFIVSMVAAGFGPDVSSRLFERDRNYTTAQLKDFAMAEDGTPARGYAIPVLLPLDLLFLFSLGLFLLFGSVSSATIVPALKPYATWFAVLPCIFIVADVSEDLSLARMFYWPDVIGDTTVTITKILTTIKIYASGLAIAQTALLAAYSMLSKQS